MMTIAMKFMTIKNAIDMCNVDKISEVMTLHDECDKDLPGLKCS